MIAFFSTLYILCLCGALTTSALHQLLNLPIVIATALPALLGSFIPFKKVYLHHPYAVIYTGCFIGMCSQTLISHPLLFLLIAFIGTSLYLLTSKNFVGFGGKLGGIAFVSIALCVLFERAIL